jgi:hypothetical protein
MEEQQTASAAHLRIANSIGTGRAAEVYVSYVTPSSAGGRGTFVTQDTKAVKKNTAQVRECDYNHDTYFARFFLRTNSLYV